ncbi:MAG TPA: exodeoxyribonuclease VII small subunit [Desulfomonilaceae bacterium]|nr:exodeoxyribonuclease VII small subunit [Desulfomonilaceae bacterium]
MKKSRDREENPEHFDAQLEQLRVLVEKMEHGGLSLDESLKLFEDGIGLSRNLFKLLNQAEGKVEELLATMERVPFNRGEE